MMRIARNTAAGSVAQKLIAESDASPVAHIASRSTNGRSRTIAHQPTPGGTDPRRAGRAGRGHPPFRHAPRPQWR
jgi:hypothetical protein